MIQKNDKNDKSPSSKLLNWFGGGAFTGIFINDGMFDDGGGGGAIVFADDIDVDVNAAVFDE